MWNIIKGLQSFNKIQGSFRWKTLCLRWTVSEILAAYFNGLSLGVYDKGIINVIHSSKFESLFSFSLILVSKICFSLYAFCISYVSSHSYFFQW